MVPFKAGIGGKVDNMVAETKILEADLARILNLVSRSSFQPYAKPSLHPTHSTIRLFLDFSYPSQQVRVVCFASLCLVLERVFYFCLRASGPYRGIFQARIYISRLPAGSHCSSPTQHTLSTSTFLLSSDILVFTCLCLGNS